MKYFLFNPNSPLIRALSQVGRLIILNLLFLLTCIPIITIGAACTSMYHITLKQAEGKEPYIAREYFAAFKANFKQSTLLWLIWMFAIAFLTLDFQVMRYQTSSIATIMRYALYAVILFADMGLAYTFPLQARFYNSIKQTLQNAFLISIRHYKCTIPIVLIPIAAICITLSSGFTLYYGIFLWLTLGFACIAQLKSRFLIKVVRYYTEATEESEATDAPEADDAAESTDDPETTDTEAAPEEPADTEE